MDCSIVTTFLMGLAAIALVSCCVAAEAPSSKERNKMLEAIVPYVGKLRNISVGL
jgi:hypothetical protein